MRSKKVAGTRAACPTEYCRRMAKHERGYDSCRMAPLVAAGRGRPFDVDPLLLPFGRSTAAARRGRRRPCDRRRQASGGRKPPDGTRGPRGLSGAYAPARPMICRCRRWVLRRSLGGARRSSIAALSRTSDRATGAGVVGLPEPGPECIFDGGDRELRSRLARRVGAGPGDGRHDWPRRHARRSVIVAPSNRVKIYAPRFRPFAASSICARGNTSMRS